MKKITLIESKRNEVVAICALCDMQLFRCGCVYFEDESKNKSVCSKCARSLARTMLFDAFDIGEGERK